MKELTVKELYTLDETIAKDIFEGVTYPWEVLPKISRFIVELGNTLSEEEYEKQGREYLDRQNSESSKKRIHYGTGDHRKRSRGQTLRVYPWQCDRGRRGSSRKFDRTEECDPVQ